MDAAADALAESLGAVASELLLATENAADDPNFSISPENCARYGIYCTVGAFDTLTHRATMHPDEWCVYIYLIEEALVVVGPRNA